MKNTNPSENIQHSEARPDIHKNINPTAQEVPERIERLEAALELVLDHLQTATRGSQILENASARNMLSAIGLGFSAVALIAFGSIAVSRPDLSIDVSRITLSMALLFLAAVLDLASGMLLQRSIRGAVSNRDQSLLTHWEGSWHRFLQLSHWKQLQQEFPRVFFYQAIRVSAFVIYLLAGAMLIWAVFSL